jgi:hypothetical protein
VEKAIMKKADKAAKITKVKMMSEIKNYTSLYDTTASGASVDLTSQVLSFAIFITACRKMKGTVLAYCSLS